jgi:hypothetical protein
MTNTTNEIEDFSLPLPISLEARTLAQEFAARQPTSEKAEQVRLNTLAVCTVNAYLQMLGFSTDVFSSDSWNPVMSLCADVADLEVTGIGKLECRPMRTFQSSCPIPLEVWDLRVGYVVVQIDESLQKASLLGFTPTVTTQEFPLNQLQPPEDLIEHLHQLKASSVISSRNSVRLSQWFDNIFETGWQTVESLLNSTDLLPAFNFRGVELSDEIENEPPQTDVRRARLIDLKLRLGESQVVLVVELKAESSQHTAIGLQVYPTGSQLYLPPELKLIVLDTSETVFMEAQARSADNYIQLQFSGQPGESFSVTVALEDASITEAFVI